jgi:hypothetical protein
MSNLSADMQAQRQRTVVTARTEPVFDDGHQHAAFIDPNGTCGPG